MDCEICKKSYDHSKNKPYILQPCNHASCIDCINKTGGQICPVCKRNYMKKNPKWLELKILPDSKYDQLNANFKQNLISINSLKTKVEFSKQKKLKENINKINKLRDEINKQTGDYISLILNKKKKILTETASIEEILNKRVYDLTNDIEFNFNLSTNLSENELEDLNLTANDFKMRLINKLSMLDDIENDFEFVFNKDCQDIEIGSIRTGVKLQESNCLNESDLIKKGDELSQKFKNYEKAIEYYNRAIELNNNSSQAYNSKGNALFEAKNFSSAIESYNISISLDPKNSKAYNNKGNCLYSLELFDQAIEQYNKAIEMDNKFTHAFNGKGNAHLENFKNSNNIKDYEEAVDCFRKAIEIDPGNFFAYNGYGSALLRNKEYDSALDCFDMALQIKNPFYLDSYNGKGLAYLGKGEYDAAIEYFNKIIELKPDHAYALHNKGVALYFNANFDSALECWRKAISLNKKFDSAILNKDLTSEIISLLNY